MIRAKLISPTNLLLEHPLIFSHRDEAEFIVLGRKEYQRHRRDWIRWGVLIGICVVLAVLLVMSFAITVFR